MITVGFTGTREGMTVKQLQRLEELLRSLRNTHGIVQFHHGDCVGADKQAHDMASYLCCQIFIHPPTNNSMRAYCTPCQGMFKELPYAARNLQIVKLTEILIATPKGMQEEQRGGTWATIRLSRHLGKVRKIIYPDGTEGK